MNDLMISQLADLVMQRLFSLTPVEASGRHVHLNREAVNILFGDGYQLKKKMELSQPGQYSCEERVTVQGSKSAIKNVIVLGPERADTQVEISATDALLLGIKASVRMSGDIAGTPGAKLVGPAGEIELREGVIIAKRHIHMTPEDAMRIDIVNNENVDVEIAGERSVLFRNVTVRVSPSFALSMHIDYDEANSCGFQKGMKGIIHKSEGR